MVRLAATIAAALVALVTLAATPVLAGEPVKLALQISDNDPTKMNAVLNVARSPGFLFRMMVSNWRGLGSCALETFRL